MGFFVIQRKTHDWQNLPECQTNQLRRGCRNLYLQKAINQRDYATYEDAQFDL